MHIHSAHARVRNGLLCRQWTPARGPHIVLSARWHNYCSSIGPESSGDRVRDAAAPLALIDLKLGKRRKRALMR